MPRTHFKLWYRINTVDRFLIWYSNDHDGVFVDPEGFVPSFRTEAALLAYADTKCIVVQSEEPLLCDLDLVQLWLEDPQPQRVVPAGFLSVWNFFGDVARTIPAVGARFIERDALLGSLYEKLFWANNLPSVTPEGEVFVPEWSPIEIGEVMALLRDGMDMLSRSIREMG